MPLPLSTTSAAQGVILLGCVLASLRQFIADIARVAVNGAGETPIDPFVWVAGSVPKEKKARVGVGDYAFLPGPPCLWEEDWTRATRTVVGEDVSSWLYSVSILLKVAAFWSSLHRPSENKDLGVGGVSYLGSWVLFCAFLGYAWWSS